MIKFKKVAIILLTLIMVFTIMGCSKVEEPTTEAATTEAVETTEADADTSASIVVDENGLAQVPVYEAREEAETDQTYDVVVIGAGGGGFAAAISAAENGASVVLLEQESVVGGNTSWSGAGMNIPMNWVQTQLGVVDSVELYAEDTMKGGDNKNNKALVDVLANNALATAEWVRDFIGVEFMDNFQKHFGGHTVARAIVVKGGVGSQMIVKQLEKALEMGIEIKANTKAEDLIIDKDGKVVGVKAVNTLGQNLTFNANNGVVIATGGFAGNVAMRMEYRPEFNDAYKTTNTPGHNGDGIVMAEKIGANAVDMEFIQTYPFCFATSGKISFVADTRMYGAPMVNIDGKRFVNENDRRDVVSSNIISQPDGFGYMVWDQSIIDEAKSIEIYGAEYAQLVEDKLLIKADTLEEAAAFFGINKEQLAETIEMYNTYAEDAITNGTDTKIADKDWARNAKMAKVITGPFYIQRVVPSIHHTMGGLEIDGEARVMGIDGNAIKGLFAAGEVTGGIHGSNRLGGNALTDILVFGKIAGETVVKDAK